MSNPHNVEKTMQKFQQLAKDAQSAGDPVLVENYLQHADHFTRVLNERESFRRERFEESSSENNPDLAEGNVDNSEENSTKDLVETSGEEKEIQKSNFNKNTND